MSDHIERRTDALYRRHSATIERSPVEGFSLERRYTSRTPSSGRPTSEVRLQTWKAIAERELG